MLNKAFKPIFSVQKYFKLLYLQNKKCIRYTKNVVKHIFYINPDISDNYTHLYTNHNNFNKNHVVKHNNTALGVC